MTHESTVLDAIAESDDSDNTENAVRLNRNGSAVATAIRGSKRAGNATIRLKTVVAAMLTVAMVAAIVVLSWQVQAKTNDIDGLNSSAANAAHAEQIALDYAVSAADMDFHDLSGWRKRLTAGTTPDLSNRLSQAASSMEQIITPLQWVSTSTPIAAKIRSVSNGAYSVDCFVSVLTKNSQAPDGVQSTATYLLTLDSRNSWVITNVGGIDSALTTK